MPANKNKKSVKKVELTLPSKKASTSTNNIQGITKNGIQRILRKAGVKRIKAAVYANLREKLTKFLQNVVGKVVILMEYHKVKTITIRHLEEGLQICGMHLAAAINPNSKRTTSLKSISSKKRKSSVKSPAEDSKSSAKKSVVAVEEKKSKKSISTTPKEKTAHRFRPGTKAMLEIRRHQRSTQLSFPKSNFRRLVDEIARAFAKEMPRFNSGVKDLLQLTAESYLVNLCKAAYMCSLHGTTEKSRITIFAKDIDLAYNIRSTCFAAYL